MPMNTIIAQKMRTTIKIGMMTTSAIAPIEEPLPLGSRISNNNGTPKYRPSDPTARSAMPMSETAPVTPTLNVPLTIDVASV